MVQSLQGPIAPSARPASFKCKKESLVLTMGKETAAQAIVGSIVWAFSQAQKTKESGDERPNSVSH